MIRVFKLSPVIDLTQNSGHEFYLIYRVTQVISIFFINQINIILVKKINGLQMGQSD